MISAVGRSMGGVHLVIAEGRDTAAYMQNDLDAILKGRVPVLFYPHSFKQPYTLESTENANIAMRAEVLNALGNHTQLVVVCPAAALSEQVVSRQELVKHAVMLKIGQHHDMEFINDHLVELEFDKVDYVYEPGQFSIRGGIVDIFSFVNDSPYRVEFFGDEIESIREFDPVTQLSNKKMERLTIVPDVSSAEVVDTHESFLSHLPDDAVIWFHEVKSVLHSIEKEYKGALKAHKKLKSPLQHAEPSSLFQDPDSFIRQLYGFRTVNMETEADFNENV